MENRLEEKQARALRTRVRITKTLLSPEIGALVIGLVLAIITQMINPNFLSANNILSLLKNCSFIGIMAIGQALIIMSGEMDLSVGNVAAFGTVVFGWLSIWEGLPWYIGALGGLLFAIIIGFLNGLLMLQIGVMKWVATLANSNLCLGLANYVARGVPITPMPEALGNFGNIELFSGAFGENTGGLSIFFLIFVLLVAIAELIIRYTRIGRMIQACGINSDSAYMAGVNTKKVKWITLIFVSILAFIGGFLVCCNHKVVVPAGLTGADFKTIAACYIGGIGFVGSAGSVLGLFFGVILLQLVENAMSSIGWDPNAQLCFIGALVMFVLVLDVIKRRYMASRIELI